MNRNTAFIAALFCCLCTPLHAAGEGEPLKIYTTPPDAAGALTPESLPPLFTPPPKPVTKVKPSQKVSLNRKMAHKKTRQG